MLPAALRAIMLCNNTGAMLLPADFYCLAVIKDCFHDSRRSTLRKHDLFLHLKDFLGNRHGLVHTDTHTYTLKQHTS